MMRIRLSMALATFVLAGAGLAAAQAQAQKPPVQPPPPAAAQPQKQAPPPAVTAPQPKPQAPARAPAASAAARASMVVMVTDMAGASAPDVRVTAFGPVPREGVTAVRGELTLQALKAGTYRLRFESADFITLERDVTVKAGPPTEVDVVLNRVPPKPPEPPPPAPEPSRAAAPPPAAGEASAHVELLALVDWIERNLVGRSDPLKETVVGRSQAFTASVVQVRDPVKGRMRGDADEVLYVIAGSGTLRLKDRDEGLDAGSLAVIPRGTTYTLERRGRNPLIALSVVGQ